MTTPRAPLKRGMRAPFTDEQLLARGRNGQWWPALTFDERVRLQKLRAAQLAALAAGQPR